MTDLQKLKGIIESVDVESKMPSPSHQNLARLVSMFMTGIIELLERRDTPSVSAVPSAPVVIPPPHPVEIEKPIEKSKRFKSPPLSGSKPKK